MTRIIARIAICLFICTGFQTVAYAGKWIGIVIQSSPPHFECEDALVCALKSYKHNEETVFGPRKGPPTCYPQYDADGYASLYTCKDGPDGYAVGSSLRRCDIGDVVTSTGCVKQPQKDPDAGNTPPP